MDSIRYFVGIGNLFGIFVSCRFPRHLPSLVVCFGNRFDPLIIAVMHNPFVEIGISIPYVRLIFSQWTVSFEFTYWVSVIAIFFCWIEFVFHIWSLVRESFTPDCNWQVGRTFSLDDLEINISGNNKWISTDITKQKIKTVKCVKSFLQNTRILTHNL